MIASNLRRDCLGTCPEEASVVAVGGEDDNSDEFPVKLAPEIGTEFDAIVLKMTEGDKSVEE